MLETHARYGALPYLDNDLLVLSLFDYEIEWGDLEPKFNVLDSKINRKSITHGSAAIVHFAGQRKPWNSPFGGSFSRMYRRELRKVYPDFQISLKQRKQFFTYVVLNVIYRLFLTPILKLKLKFFPHQLKQGI
jgi:lipopolysaccharide biosynthesis glycosyltransferase